jgi:glycerate 2-kinase
MRARSEPRDFLLSLWNAAVAAASVGASFRALLPPPPRGRIVVVGAGKAAAAMAAAAASVYGPDVEGVVVTRVGHGLRTGETSGSIRIIEACHPIPDAAGLAAGDAVLRAVAGLHEDDLVLCLISGGGSALLEAPLPGVSLDDVKVLNKRLLESGAAISDINCVRKHVSAVKGGRLAVAAWPARVVTLAISDVPGDDPGTIASGPTVGDSASSADARTILQRYCIAVSPAIASVLDNPACESPKPSDPHLLRSEFRLVATQADALNAAALVAHDAGFSIVNRGTHVEGEARNVAEEEARIACDAAARGENVVILGGGELTVTLDGAGSGGPNREYALALALALKEHKSIWALAADTDGIDGTDDGAGAIVEPDTLVRARNLGLDPLAFLDNHNSGAFFSALGDTLVTGPTRTNVSDFRAIMVLGK